MHKFQSVARASCGLLVLAMANALVLADDWTRFRGPDGAGVSADTSIPLKWSETENLRWKAELPGPGSSSPIVTGKRVLVTCYSGYGMSKTNAGSLQTLQRHLVCVNRDDGKIVWIKNVSSDQPEDGYQGYISEHGYASSTPVTDGAHVYCFFGKTGVVAFDMDGQQLWKKNVGRESSNRRWGSAASLILYKDSVIVNASEESQSIRALDKFSGKELWQAPGAALELAYGTPLLLTLKDTRQELVVAAPGEVWGIDPDTGKLQWFAEHKLTGNICPSVIGEGETTYIFGGFRSVGSLAVRAGGTKNVTNSHIAWTSRSTSYVATPVLHNGYLYWISDNGQAFCINAKTGEEVYRQRVSEIAVGGRPVYASPVVANGKIYVPTRWSGVIVLPAEPKYAVLAQNRMVSDESDFNATPAISDGQMFLRSNRFLYCVEKQELLAP